MTLQSGQAFDGIVFSEKAADNIELLTAKDNLAVFGLRHQEEESRRLTPVEITPQTRQR